MNTFSGSVPVSVICNIIFTFNLWELMLNWNLNAIDCVCFDIF